jgi:hypothetical protein
MHNFKVGQVIISGNYFVREFSNKKARVISIDKHETTIKWICDKEMIDFISKIKECKDVNVYGNGDIMRQFFALKDEEIKCRKT